MPDPPKDPKDKDTIPPRKAPFAPVPAQPVYPVRDPQPTEEEVKEAAKPRPGQVAKPSGPGAGSADPPIMGPPSAPDLNPPGPDPNLDDPEEPLPEPQKKVTRAAQPGKSDKPDED